MISSKKEFRFGTISLLSLYALLLLKSLPSTANETQTQAAETPESKPADSPATASETKITEPKPVEADETVDPFTAIGNTVPESSQGQQGGVATGSGVHLTDKDVSEVTYDQRQNGTQNVRIHLDDVTLIVAPSDGIMSLFAGQAQHAFIQNAESAQAQNSSVQGHAAGVHDDPYAEFDELISTANFLKSHGASGAGSAAGKTKKCTDGRCKGKRTKLNLTRYLLPILAQSHPDNQNEVVQRPRPIGTQ